VRKTTLRVVGLALFVALCATGIYSNYIGASGPALRDAAHTQLVQYGRGPARYLTAQDFAVWQMTWIVIGVLLAGHVVLFFVGWRFERGRWPWNH
jgi:hypothetical protein